MHIATLYERTRSRENHLPRELADVYDGDLSFPGPHADRPYMIANFVQTIDGVVSFGIPGKSGGGEISGGSAEDRFVMGLLRSMADAVLVGSGTLHGDPGHVRTPEFIYPEARQLYAELRRKSGKPLLPLNVILTASGRIDFDEPTFHTEGLQPIIITTEEGMERLEHDHGNAASHVIVRSTGESDAAPPVSVLRILGEEFGVRLLLHEGGPTVFGGFLRAGAIDELFLTLAPQIAGRSASAPRPSIAGEAVFVPASAPWLTLQSLKRGSEHLLIRYTAQRSDVA
jgi:riboflavin biosynthesis pyrimidine reductase